MRNLYGWFHSFVSKLLIYLSHGYTKNKEKKTLLTMLNLVLSITKTLFFEADKNSNRFSPQIVLILSAPKCHLSIRYK